MPELDGLSLLPRVSLAEVLATAEATTRVDRKYIVAADTVTLFLDRAPASLRLLSIDGRLTTSYRSTYFDTPDLATCRAHVQGRRLRWKARSRLYVEDGLCRLELKVRDGSGLTRKVFLPMTAADYGVLDPVGARFIVDQLTRHGLPDHRDLEAATEVSYRRATLADPSTGARVTIDVGVRATRRGSTVELDPGHCIVETKGGRVAGAADRLLTELRERPTSFSKYAASTTLMDTRIPDNDVRRLVGRYLHVTGHPHSPAGRGAPDRLTSDDLPRTA